VCESAEDVVSMMEIGRVKDDPCPTPQTGPQRPYSPGRVIRELNPLVSW
jgi:hypothetical protein